MTDIDSPAERCCQCGQDRPETSPSAWFCDAVCQAEWAQDYHRTEELHWLHPEPFQRATQQ